MSDPLRDAVRRQDAAVEAAAQEWADLLAQRRPQNEAAIASFLGQVQEIAPHSSGPFILWYLSPPRFNSISGDALSGVWDSDYDRWTLDKHGALWHALRKPKKFTDWPSEYEAAKPVDAGAVDSEKLIEVLATTLRGLRG